MEIPQEELRSPHSDAPRRFKSVLEDSHHLSFIRTHKGLLRYLLFDKAAGQFLKQKYADASAAEELVVAIQGTPKFTLSRALL